MNTRKAFGKILVVALFVLLFTLLLTVSASAATHDVATEAQLTTALTNAADGDTINVTQDITLTAAITLNKQLTFEGNGNTITTSTVGVPFNVESDVTFNNISLTNTKSASHLFGIWAGKTGSVTKNGAGTFSTTQRLFHVEGTLTVDINGGTLNSSDRIFHVEKGTLTADVTGTASTPVTVTASHAVCGEQSGTSNVTFGANTTVTLGGYFNHFKGAVSGSTTVNGATITASNIGVYSESTGKIDFTFNSGSLKSNGYIVQYNGSGNGKATITGGTLENTKSGSQGLVNTGNGTMDLDISGGTVIANAQVLWYSAGGGGTIDITGTPTITGSYWNLGNGSCTGRIVLNLGGSPTMNFSVSSDAIQLTTKAASKVTLSGKWTMGKVFYFSNAAHEVEIVGNDTEISVGTFYSHNNNLTVTVKAGKISSTMEALVISRNTGTKATLNVQGGTVSAGKYLVRPYNTSAITVTVDAGTVTSADTMFLAGDSATINATVNGGELSATGHMIHADGTPTVNLTVTGGKLSSVNWFTKYETSAKGDITYSGGEVDVSNNHHIVNFGDAAVNFTMTGGTLKNKNSTVFYENKTGNATAKNTVKVTGGTITGNYCHISSNSEVDVEFSGTATFESTGTMVSYMSSSKGHMTIGGSANISGSSIGLEGSGKIDLTISGTPTITTSATYNGINHKSTGGGKITLSGTWSTNKTIYFANSKKTVEIKGADTNITVGGSGFYAEGCELELTMNEGTVNVSNNFVCYLSGATGSVTMGGTAKCYFTNSHAFHITNASPTVTIQGSAQVISNATSGDKEIFNIVNGANPTIYVKDNVTLFTPNAMWGHAFRIGDTGGNTPANATVYIQGSTKAGDEGIDIDVSRVIDVRTKSSIYLEVTGKVNMNSDAGPFRAHNCAESVEVYVRGNDIVFENGNEPPFYFYGKHIVFEMEGDFTVSTTAGHMITIEGAPADAAVPHVVTLTGNFNFTSNGANSYSTFYVGGSATCNITVSAREGNTTDKFVANTGRLTNFRENTTVDIRFNTNEITATTIERIGYAVSCTDIDISFTAPIINLTTKAEHQDTDCFFTFNNYSAGKKVNMSFNGKVSFINASIGTDHERNPVAFGVWGTHAETVVLDLNLYDMDLSSVNWKDSTEISYSSIVLNNCTGTLNITDTFTAPQIHVKGGSISTVITGTANLGGLGKGLLNGGLLYSNGATGSITISGNGTLNHSTGHGIELNGVSVTVTVQDNASIISSATATDYETFNIVNGANPTIYIKDNATLFTPDGKWAHNFRIGANSDLDKTNPSNATIYIQGSTVAEDKGIDIDGSRIFDVRNNNSMSCVVTGKVDMTSDNGIIRANATANSIKLHILGNDVHLTSGSEEPFFFAAKKVDFVLEGDHTIVSNNANIFGFTSSSETTTRTVTLKGNFNITIANGAYSMACFYVEGSSPLDLTISAREGNTTDKFVFNGGRVFNFRDNTVTTVDMTGNEASFTLAAGILYSTNVASCEMNIHLTKLVATGCGESVFNFNNKAQNSKLNLSGNIDITASAAIDFVYVGAGTTDVKVEGSSGANDTGFVIKGINRLSNMRDNVVGNLTVTGKGSITVLEKLLYHVNCSTNIVFGGSITATNNNWAFIYINNPDTVERHSTITLKDNVVMRPTDTALCADGLGANVVMTVEGNAKIEGPGYLIYFASDSKGSATIKDNASLISTGEPIYFGGNASGSVTITGSANISGTAIVLEGTGDIDLTVSGTPTLTLTSKYNGIQHKATGEADIVYSGVWSTNKTIFHKGGKKNVTITGADTVITCASIYSDAGTELIVTVDGGATINSTSGEGIFTSANGGITRLTVNNATLKNTNKYLAVAHSASQMYVTINGGELSSNSIFFRLSGGATGSLTVNGGTLSSGSYFTEVNDTSSGSVTYTGGTIKVKDHNLVNFGSGKVDFTMTGGTVTAPNSLIWYENKSGNAPATNVVSITGGSHTGGNMNVLKNTDVKITIGGNANLTFTAGWVFKYNGDVTGSVTLCGNAVITGNEHGFVNNGSKQVDFTIKENASFTITKNTMIYYGGTFPSGVVNNVNILGGTMTDSGTDSAFTFPGNGAYVVNISGGTITSNSNTLLFGGKGSATVTISGGTLISNSNDCIETANSADFAVNITVSGGTFHGKHKDLTYGSGYPIQVWGKNSSLTITGGNFLADYAHAAIMVAGGATGTIYGGYFEAGALCCARACNDGTLNIYGGEFYYNGTTGYGNQPIRSGTGSVSQGTATVGNVNIYGGNYRTAGTGAIFCVVNTVSNLTVHGGYNAYGGGTLVANENKTNGGTPTTGMPIGSIVASDSIYMAAGAAVRIVEGSSGLRFMGKISASSLAYLRSIADANSIRFGTLIAPVDYVQQVDRFTKAELDAAGLSYLNLAADNGLIECEDGSYEIRTALTNIKPENKSREFAAVCYVIYSVDGHEIINYATYRETKNARSIEQVARLALQDGRRYNENQLNILNALAPTTEAPVIDLYLIAGQSNAAGSTNFSEAFRNSNSNFTEGYPNIYYSGTAAGGSAYVSKNFVEVDLVKAGYGGNPVTGMGAELGMAEALSQYYNEETGRTAAIIKYGYGGTALADTIGGQNFPEGSWTSPSWLAEHGKKDANKSGGLYRAFVAQIESSISDYRAMGYDVNIVAAYWMQGESDRTNANYAAMFEAWVNDLRADVYALTRDKADKSLPVLVGEISYSYNPSDMQYNAPFIEVQNQMAQQISNLYIIKQSPLATASTRSDTGHWSCDDMLLIGQMVATTALNELVLGAEDEKYEMPYLTGTPVAEVYDAEGNLIETYSSFSWAINTAPAGATVKLLDDLTIYGPLGINNPNKITVDGGNFMVDVMTDQGDAMKLIATDLTLKDFNIKNHGTEWGMQTYRGAKFIWNGGSFEAESIGVVMNDASIGQFHNVDVTVRNGVESYSAAIYMGDASADVWVNGGTVTAYGNAEAIRANTGYITVSGDAVIIGGTGTAYAISQRSGEGYLAIGNDVSVTGGILNKGDGYLAGEDVYEFPVELPEVPEIEVPEIEEPAA